ncbi:hypothetical protein BV20DRAFT_622331 [Pilatotrama ljubarskyi]|nr:hypothetical protein BV20DRAFT_622331 [Pilatotrama ljubarskyi]
MKGGIFIRTFCSALPREPYPMHSKLLQNIDEEIDKLLRNLRPDKRGGVIRPVLRCDFWLELFIPRQPSLISCVRRHFVPPAPYSLQASVNTRSYTRHLRYNSPPISRIRAMGSQYCGSSVARLRLPLKGVRGDPLEAYALGKSTIFCERILYTYT